MSRPTDHERDLLLAPTAPAKQNLILGSDGEIEVITPQIAPPDAPKRKRKSRNPTILLIVAAIGLSVSAGFLAALVLLSGQRQQTARPAATLVPPSAADTRYSDSLRLLLASQAEQAFERKDYDLALKLAMEASRNMTGDETSHSFVYQALVRAAYAPTFRAKFTFDSAVNDMVVFPDGKTIAVALAYNEMNESVATISLIDSFSGAEIRRLPRPSVGAHFEFIQLAVSPNGQMIAGLGNLSSPSFEQMNGFMIDLYDVTTGAWLYKTIHSNGQIGAFAFSSDSKTLLFGEETLTGSQTDYQVYLWHVAKEKVTGQLKGMTSPIIALGALENGLVYALGQDGKVALWPLGVPDPAPVFYQASGTEFAEGAIGAISPSARLFVRADHTSARPEFWRPDGSPILPLRAHSKPIVAVAISPDEQFLATADAGGQVAVWEANERPENGYAFRDFWLEDRITALQFSQDNRFLYISTAARLGIGGSIFVWPLNPPSQLASMRFDQPISHMLRGTSTHDVWAILADDRKKIREVDMRTNQVNGLSLPFPHVSSITHAFESSTIGVCASQDGHNYAAMLYNTITREVISLPHPPGTNSCSHVLMPIYNSTVLLAHTGREILVWDLRTQTLIGTLSHNSYPFNAKFSPDGKYILTADIPTLDAQAPTLRSVKLWYSNVPGSPYTPVGEYRIDTAYGLTSAIISPDNKWLAIGVGGFRSEIRLIGISDQTFAAKLVLKDSHTPLAFTPDSKQLLTTGEPVSSLLLWDVETGARLHSFAQHSYLGTTRHVEGLFVVDDVAYAHYQGNTVRAWQLPGDLQSLRKWVAANRQVTPFSMSEIRQYGVSPLENQGVQQ
jgi:WD40 repeat protein